MSTKRDVDRVDVRDVIGNDVAALINVDIKRTQVQELEVCDIDAGAVRQEELRANVLKALHVKKEIAVGVVV